MKTPVSYFPETMTENHSAHVRGSDQRMINTPPHYPNLNGSEFKRDMENFRDDEESYTEDGSYDLLEPESLGHDQPSDYKSKGGINLKKRL